MTESSAERSWIPISLILLATLLIRLAAIVWNPLPEISRDASQYYAIGGNLLRGSYAIVEGLPTLHRLPVYPVFISMVMVLFGPGVRGILVAQAMLDTLACGLLWLLARLFYGSRGQAAALYAPPILYAFFVPSILACGVVDSELVFTFFLIATMFAITRALTEPRGRRSVVAGVLIGLADLTRGGLLPFGFVVALLLAQRGRRISYGLAFLAAYAGVIAPWLVRNFVTFERPALYATNGGDVLWAGNNPYSGGRYLPKRSPLFQRFLLEHPEFQEYEGQSKAGAPEPYEGRLALRRDRAFRDLAVKSIAADPVGFFRRMPRKFFDLYWAPYLAVPKKYSIFEKVALELFHLLILAGGLLGYIQIRHGPKTVFGLLVIYWTLVHLVTYGSPRFAYPILFVFILFFGEFLGRMSALRPRTC